MNPEPCKNIFFYFICAEPIKIDGLITLLVAFLTLVIAGVSFLTQNNNQKASNLLILNENIANARKEFDDVCILKLTTKDIDETGYAAIYNTKVEKVVYAYESACKFYFDKAINQQNFRNTRQLEIRQMIENDPFKTILKDKERSEYTNLWLAYSEFKK
jgi:hypothetical protein